MKQDYRLDIQGLRAISVLLVFFAHANWQLFSGGFVGVDIFFVISGYVISLLLLKDYKASETILFHRFYARRLQRLLPALIVVIISTAIATLIILPPVVQVSYYDSAISAIFWFSNIFYSFSEINYFSPIADKELYMHTWSLGVEEQFYLLWPLVVLFGLARLRKRSYLIIFISTVIVSSIVLQYYFTKDSSNLAFYMMPARAWQFGLGCLVAIFHFSKTKSNVFDPKSSVMELSTIIGITLILFASTMFDSSTPYPNWQVFIPSIGALLLLLPNYSGSYSGFGKLLSLKPLVLLGNISYSFYLWHWIILVFSEKLQKYYHFMHPVFAFVLTILLSIATYQFIEQPIRRSVKIKARAKLTIIFSLLIMLLVASLLYLLKKVSEKLESDPRQSEIVRVMNKLPIVYDDGCDDWYHSSDLKNCVYGNLNSEKRVVVFGDSILLQWFPTIKEYYERNSWKIIVFTKSGCPIINRPFFYYRIRAEYTSCEIWRNSVLEEIKDKKPSLVIIGNSTTYPFGKDDWINGSKEIIDELLLFSDEIKIIAGTPEMSFSPPLCLMETDWLSRVLPKISLDICSHEMIESETWDWQKEISMSYKDVDFINMEDIVCPEKYCHSVIDNTIVFRDHIHLTIDFVKKVKLSVWDKFNKK